MTLCSLLLEFEPCNAKALFRRVQANLQLGDVWQALCDLKAVVQVEPNNVEIVREIARVKNGDSLIDETRQEFQLSSSECYYASDGEQPSYRTTKQCREGIKMNVV